MRISKTFWLGLLGVTAGVGLAALVVPKARVRSQMRDGGESARVDEASEDSFPASDPPSFSAPPTAVPGPTA